MNHEEKCEEQEELMNLIEKYEPFSEELADAILEWHKKKMEKHWTSAYDVGFKEGKNS